MLYLVVLQIVKLHMAGDKHKGNEIAVEPRNKTKAEKEAEWARLVATVAE